MAGCAPLRVADHTSLQSRIARSHTKAAVNVPFVGPCCPQTYQGYSSLRMDKACVKPCCHTNLVYVWQRRSTNDKVSGKVPVQAKSGRKAYLTDEEEDRPVEFLVGCASVGYAKSCRDVLAIAQQVFNARNPNCDVELTKGWWDRFGKQHPEISLRQAETLSYARAAANNPKVIEAYFDLPEETIETNGLAHRPGQIFNCDETGMPLNALSATTVRCGTTAFAPGLRTEVPKTKSISVFLASRLDNILAIHCSRPYMTAIFTVAILPIPIFDDHDTSCSI